MTIRPKLTTGKNLPSASIGIKPRDGGKNILIAFADIAGSSNRHIKFPVRAKRDVFPSVVSFGRIVIRYNHRFRWTIQFLLDAGKLDDPADLRDVKVAILEGDSIRRI